MLIPPVMPRAATITQRGGKPIDYYEISMRQFAQQILPAGLPATTVWGYGAKAAQSKRGLLIHNAPSLTIEARWNRPVRVKWINELVDANGNYLPHLLPVDPTLHWANPPGGTAVATRDPTSRQTPGPYTGPVPIVTHVHGAVGVGDESDGYAEAWYLPAANNIPAGYATEGTWYDFFAGKAAAKSRRRLGTRLRHLPVPERGPGVDDLVPRPRARHDAAQRLRGPGRLLPRSAAGPPATTRCSTAAPARGRASGPGAEGRTTSSRPTSPTTRSRSRSRTARSTRTARSSTPTRRAFFDGIVGPTTSRTATFSPIWNPEFFGNTIMVNGNTWPFQTVEQRRYRFRFLNGCQSRFLILDFGEIPGRRGVADRQRGRLPRRPGEPHRRARQPAAHGPGRAGRPDRRLHQRAASATTCSRNVGPDEPFGGGEPDEDFDVADPETTGQIMQFRVVPAVGVDDSTPAAVPPAAGHHAAAAGDGHAAAGPDREDGERSSTRTGDEVEGPVEALLGTVDDGVWTERKWMDPVTENPASATPRSGSSTTPPPTPTRCTSTRSPSRSSTGRASFVDEDDEVVQPSSSPAPDPPEPWETGLQGHRHRLPGPGHPGQGASSPSPASSSGTATSSSTRTTR